MGLWHTEGVRFEWCGVMGACCAILVSSFSAWGNMLARALVLPLVPALSRSMVALNHELAAILVTAKAPEKLGEFLKSNGLT